MAQYLKDYKKPDFKIAKIFLTIELFNDHALVINEMDIEFDFVKNNKIFLNGECQNLKEIIINNHQYKNFLKKDNGIFINDLPRKVNVKIKSVCFPHNNKTLEGLYQADDGLFLTQCESHGFSKITFYPDRPDIMTYFNTKIICDKKYKTVLANGNLVSCKELNNNRHLFEWYCKSKMPSYLFAIIIGNLASLKESFKTKSGRNVELEIFAQKENINNCRFALEALKHAIKWDEDSYDREYDLDHYKIVSAPKFNMGAMENKGLNIFNAALLEANKDIATDTNFQNIMGVVAHEYFHNWSGNLVTLSNWFQLTLKEGLTVFRDQEFSAHIYDQDIKRIEDVINLKRFQFKEDDGGFAHPPIPKKYNVMNNFYTVTVYEKGAEIVRMLQSIVGKNKFQECLKQYFDQYKEKAITINEFLNSFSKYVDIELFQRWYYQAGTPIVTFSAEYNDAQKSLILKLTQNYKENNLFKDNKELLIPIKLSFIGKKSKKAINATYLNETNNEFIILFKEGVSEFHFSDIEEDFVISINRDFTAPINVKSQHTYDDLFFLFENDNNLVNKWLIEQQIFRILIIDIINNKNVEEKLLQLLKSLEKILSSKLYSKAYKAKLLEVPNFNEIAGSLEIIDPRVITKSINYLKNEIAYKLKSSFEKIYIELQQKYIEYKSSNEQIEIRSLKSKSLTNIAYCDKENAEYYAINLYNKSDNLTDRITALSVIFYVSDDDSFEKYRKHFYNKWCDTSIVKIKLYNLIASSKRKNLVDIIYKLMKDTDFDISNPNEVYSLFMPFMDNIEMIIKDINKSYDLIFDFIAKIDKINPQVSSRIIKKLDNWKNYTKEFQEIILSRLKNLSKIEHLSNDSKEVVSSLLNY